MHRILEMSGELAERLLEDQAAGRDVSEDRVRPLIEAAMLLEEHGLPWPPGMMQVLQAIDRPPPDDMVEAATEERSEIFADGPPPDAEGFLGRLFTLGRRRD